jgi:large subunit ribosomal protein L35
MKLVLLAFASLALCAQAFVATPVAPVLSRAVHSSPADALSMTSANKKAKAAVRKAKSSRAATKRFKATSTGKLLRRYAGKAHLLRKKRPQHLAKLRRVGQCSDAELDTYQRLLLVVPKRS